MILYWTRCFEGKYASWADFKKAMYKERVDQFKNLKQVTFKDPTKPWPNYTTETINQGVNCKPSWIKLLSRML